MSSDQDPYEKIKGGDVKYFETLLKTKDINAVQKGDRTMLYDACFERQPELVKLFLSYGADPNKGKVNAKNPNDTVETPLHAACTNGCRIIVELLLSNNADPLITKKSNGKTALRCLEDSPGILQDDRSAMRKVICDKIREQLKSDLATLLEMAEEMAARSGEVVYKSLPALHGKVAKMAWNVEDVKNRVESHQSDDDGALGILEELVQELRAMIKELASLIGEIRKEAMKQHKQARKPAPVPQKVQPPLPQPAPQPAPPPTIDPSLVETNRSFPERFQRIAIIQTLLNAVSAVTKVIKVFDLSEVPSGAKMLNLDDFYDMLLARDVDSAKEVCKAKGFFEGLQYVAVDLAEFFDPRWDFDFTHISDGQNTFTRGDEVYKRPCGWKRYAINVDRKYGRDTRWLQCTGRKDSGEWPVSYHGTKKEFVDKIVKTEYKTGPRAAYGRGVYSSPEIDTATAYASTYTEDDTSYKVIMQNRINPDKRKIVSSTSDYWLVPEKDEQEKYNRMSECIRPYGVLIRKV